ncbi:MAG: HAD-IA family hydrolase [Deltaproteobacteria bacterium]|nr:HAD-IA family hydrolase [Deltaproteobacteria bacterium]
MLIFIEESITREDYEGSKPDPEPYIAALNRLQLTAKQRLAIEDSARGLAAVSGAGLSCIVNPSSLT